MRPIDAYTLAVQIRDNVFHDFTDEFWGVMQCIREAPTIEPERKTGRWKMESDPYGFFEEIPVCSECGCTTEMRKTYNFCPNCGADMRGEQDD